MAIRKRLTKKYLSSISPTGKEFYVKDTSLQGFGVRVFKKGHISFIVEGKVKGSRTMRRKTIGPFPAYNIEQAKEEASEYLRLLSKGLDPVDLKQREEAEKYKQEALDKSLGINLGEIVAKYYQGRELKPKTQYDYENTFKNHLSDWMDLPVRSITRQMVEQRFFDIKRSGGRSKKESGKATASKTMRMLSAVLNYAKAEEIDGVRLIESNPCDVLKEKRINKSVGRRTNFLTPKEVGIFINALEEPPDGYGYSFCSQSLAVALTLILLTGLRRNEAFNLKWEDVNTEWEVPYFVVRDTKNSTAHYVPLTKNTAELLNSLSSKGKSEWVFPSVTNPKRPISEPRIAIKKLGNMIGKDFTPHDLRRTFTTIASEVGIDYLAIKRLLNHSIQDITEQYVINECREKLVRVRGHLEQIEVEILKYSWGQF